MDNTICGFCKDTINEQSGELAIYFERECQAIRDSAMSGCRVCGILKADLDLVEKPAEEPEAKASVFFTYVEPFLDPENDPWGLMLGLNNTPLRYLLWEPEKIEPLMVEDSQTHSDTSSVACFNQARAWLQKCVTEHEHCHPTDSTFRPTRLLSIEEGGKFVSLCVGSNIPPGTQYATLSHCWGDTMPGQLTMKNIEALESSIPPAFLGKSFSDAARIAFEMGLRFIWIDSLCIIQDSPEDWHSESAKMSLVYSNSMCNIAATSASNVSEGCFRAQSRSTSKPVKLTLGRKKDHGTEETNDSDQEDGRSLYLTDAVHWWQRFQKEPLNRRAWVVQERLLSARNLHYDRDQIVWECNELVASERFPKGFGDLIRARPLRVPLDSALRNAQENHIPGQALHEIWRPVVNAFTSTNITKPTDRLIALHGVGSRMQEVCGWPYVAGIFLKNLPSQLCWAAVGDVALERPQMTIAPSWSWASVSGPVDMMPQWDLVENDRTGEGPGTEDLREEYLCEIIDVERGSLPTEDTGHVSSATLHVSCYMVPATLSRPEDVEQEQLDKHASNLREHQTYNNHRFKTRPLWLNFDFVDGQESHARNLSRHDTEIKPDAEVKITWDVWSGLKPATARELWLMPAYSVREYANWQPSTSYRIYKAVHGLILRLSDSAAAGKRTFERCGTFTIDKGWHTFWTRALAFGPIDGVHLQQRNGILVPEMDEKKRREFTKQNGVFQYQISVI